MSFIGGELGLSGTNSSESESETLYRIATPSGQSVEGDYPSSKDDVEKGEVSKAKRYRPKLVTGSKHTKVTMGSKKSKSRVPKKVGKASKPHRSFDSKNVRTETEVESRSSSPASQTENSNEETNLVFSNSNRRHSNIDDTTTVKRPNSLHTNGGAQGNRSGRFPPEERLSRAPRPEKPKESVRVVDTNNATRSTFTPRNIVSGGRQQYHRDLYGIKPSLYIYH